MVSPLLRSTRSRANASLAPSSANSNRTTDGPASSKVSPSSRASANSVPTLSLPSECTSRRAPPHSAARLEQNPELVLGCVVPRKPSAAVMCQASRYIRARRSAARVEITMPLGRPVLPEV